MDYGVSNLLVHISSFAPPPSSNLESGRSSSKGDVWTDGGCPLLICWGDHFSPPHGWVSSVCRLDVLLCCLSRCILLLPCFASLCIVLWKTVTLSCVSANAKCNKNIFWVFLFLIFKRHNVLVACFMKEMVPVLCLTYANIYLVHQTIGLFTLIQYNLYWLDFKEKSFPVLLFEII